MLSTFNRATRAELVPLKILQESEEWHHLRKNKIGASMAPIIMGVSPWKTPTDLWSEMIGLKQKDEITPYQQRGLNLEDAARRYFYIMTGYEVFPQVFICKTNSWMMASLDGITHFNDVALEIKCPGRNDHLTALSGEIPKKYYPQIQHQLAVTGLDMIYYLSYDGEAGVILTVQRDQEYIDYLIEKEKEFYECIQNFIPPNIDEKVECPEWKEAASKLVSIQKTLKELQIFESSLKDTLIKLAREESCEGHGVKLTKYVRKGSIDYDRMLLDMGIEVDLEKYRKEEVESWKITTK